MPGGGPPRGKRDGGPGSGGAAHPPGRGGGPAVPACLSIENNELSVYGIDKTDRWVFLPNGPYSLF